MYKHPIQSALKTKLIKLPLILLTAASAVLPLMTQAASDTWNKTAAGTYSWNAGADWLSGTQFPNNIGDVANVSNSITGAQTINLNQAITVGTLNLGSDGGAWYGFTLSPNGGSLTFNTATGNAVLARCFPAAPGGSDTINTTLTLNTNLTISEPFVGSANGINLNGVISGPGGMVVAATNFPAGGNLGALQQVTFASNMTNNSFTGNFELANGNVIYYGSVISGQPSALGASTNAVLIGSSNSIGGTGTPSISGQTTMLMRLATADNTNNYVFTRDLDFSQASQGTNPAAQLGGRASFYFYGSYLPGLSSNSLTLGGVITLAPTNRSTEILAQRQYMSVYITNAINQVASAGGNLYWNPLAPGSTSTNGPVCGTIRLSALNRNYTVAQTLDDGVLVIEGSVGATGAASPIGGSTLGLSDGNGGDIAMQNAQEARRAVFLATPGASYARTLAPGGGLGETYDGGSFNVFNGYQFGGLNTSGTVTFSGNITCTDPNIGNNTPNVITVGQNYALIQATGGTAIFSGVIGDTPSSSTVTRVTINQFRNHPSLVTNISETSPLVGVANALVGAPTGGTVILSATNTYQGGTEVLGGTLLVNSASGSGTGSGAVIVQPNATLGGSGAIAGAVTFNTGSSALFTNGAVLTLSNALIISSGVSVSLNLSNNVPAGSYTLATYNTSGSSGSFNSAPVIASGSFAANTAAAIVTSGGSVVLQVTSTIVNTTTALATSGSPSTYGASVTFTATVQTNGTAAGNATGSLVFTVDGTPAATNTVAAGQAAFSTSGLTFGSHSIQAAYGGDSNYAASTNSLTQNVGAVSLTITANNASQPYNGLPFGGGSVTYSGFVNGDSSSVLGGVLSYGGTSQGAINAGGYTIIPSGLTSTNYAINYINGTLTVNQAALTVTASAQSKTYGQPVTFGSGSTSFTSGGLQNGETIGTVTLTCSGGASNAPVSGSPYTITPTAATGGTFSPGNYNITYNPATLTVAPLAAVLTGTATYNGTTNVTNSILTVSNAVGSDDVNVASGSAGMASADIGTNAITSVANLTLGGATAGNYTLAGAGGAVTVAPLVVTLTGTRPYDGTTTAAASILTVSNAVGSDDVSLASGSATLAGSAAGAQTITDPSGLALGGLTSSNYSLTGASGSVTITNPFSTYSITSSSLDSTGTNLVVCWQSVPGVVYNVLTNTSLAAPESWAVAGGPITASNTTTCFSVPGSNAGNTQTFVVIKQ